MVRGAFWFITCALSLASAGAGTAVAQEAMANDFIGKFRAWIVLDFKFALTTAEGRTVYSYANDSPMHPAFYDICEQAWFPVVAIPQDVAYEPFTIFARADGLKQWAYEGVPLYTSARDTRSGEANGHGVDGLWHIVTVPAHAMQ
jgi:predicted lipoprotein with Yx(FWY)xxD motif